VAFVLAFSLVAEAQAPAPQIEQRQNAMKGMGGANRVLTPIVRGEQPWNQAAVVQQLTTVNNTAKAIPTLFPDNAQGGNALPSIWQNKADFEAKAKNLETVSANLLQLAQANNEAGFKAAVGQLGGACGGCHTPYRKPQQ
jgi:cytochrome c556